MSVHEYGANVASVLLFVFAHSGQYGKAVTRVVDPCIA